MEKKRTKSICLFDLVSLPLLLRPTQITLVDMKLAIPPSRPSGLLSLA